MVLPAVRDREATPEARRRKLQALESDLRHRKEELMREGYEERAEVDLELAREFEQLDESAGWPDR